MNRLRTAVMPLLFSAIAWSPAATAQATQLTEAAARGDAQKVAALVASGANVNEVDWMDDTPLDKAKFYDHPEVVDILKKAGGNARRPHAAEPTPNDAKRVATNWSASKDKSAGDVGKESNALELEEKAARQLVWNRRLDTTSGVDERLRDLFHGLHDRPEWSYKPEGPHQYVVQMSYETESKSAIRRRANAMRQVANGAIAYAQATGDTKPLADIQYPNLPPPESVRMSAEFEVDLAKKEVKAHNEAARRILEEGDYLAP